MRARARSSSHHHLLIFVTFKKNHCVTSVHLDLDLGVENFTRLRLVSETLLQNALVQNFCMSRALPAVLNVRRSPNGLMARKGALMWLAMLEKLLRLFCALSCLYGKYRIYDGISEWRWSQLIKSNTRSPNTEIERIYNVR